MSALLIVLISLPALNLCLPNKITDFVPLPSLPEIGDGKPNNATIKTKKVFFISKDNSYVNWHLAERTCVANGLHLASIRNEEENDQLVSLMKKYRIDEIWIGGTDLGADGHFYWVPNGASFGYKNWRSGEPNNYDGTDEQCVVMRPDGKWNDGQCPDELDFACEGYVAA